MKRLDETKELLAGFKQMTQKELLYYNMYKLNTAYTQHIYIYKVYNMYTSYTQNVHETYTQYIS